MQRVNPTTLKGGTALPPTFDIDTVPPKPVVLTQAQTLQIAIDALQANDPATTYKTIYRIERLTAKAFAQKSVVGTPYEPVVTALNAHGVVTAMTLGGAMGRMYPDLNAKDRQRKANSQICFCVEESTTIKGARVVGYLTADLKTAKKAN